MLHQDESNLWKKDIKLKDVRWFEQWYKVACDNCEIIIITTAVGSLWSVLHQILDTFSLVIVWGFLNSHNNIVRGFLCAVYSTIFGVIIELSRK